MHATFQTIILFTAQIILLLVALLALYKTCQGVKDLVTAYQNKRKAQKTALLQERISDIAPHVTDALNEWPDMPKLTLSIDLVPQFSPHFNPVPLQQWVNHHAWKLQLLKGNYLLYHHPDDVLLYISNVHHHGALPLSPDYPKALEQVFALRISLMLPSASHSTIATHALLTTADAIAEQLQAKPCLPNKRQRLSPQEREQYHQAAATHQHDYTKWQFEQLHRHESPKRFWRS